MRERVEAIKRALERSASERVPGGLGFGGAGSFWTGQLRENDHKEIRALVERYLSDDQVLWAIDSLVTWLEREGGFSPEEAAEIAKDIILGPLFKQYKLDKERIAAEVKRWLEDLLKERDLCDPENDEKETKPGKEPKREVEPKAKTLTARFQAEINELDRSLSEDMSPAESARQKLAAIHSFTERTAKEIVELERAQKALTAAALKQLKAELKPLYNNKEIRDWTPEQRRALVDHINETCRRAGVKVAQSSEGPWGSLALQGGKYFQIRYTDPNSGETAADYVGATLPKLQIRTPK